MLDSCRALEGEGFDVSYLPVQTNGILDLKVGLFHARANIGGKSSKQQRVGCTNQTVSLSTSHVMYFCVYKSALSQTQNM